MWQFLFSRSKLSMFPLMRINKNSSVVYLSYIFYLYLQGDDVPISSFLSFACRWLIESSCIKPSTESEGDQI